jgi:hypothetical protein
MSDIGFYVFMDNDVKGGADANGGLLKSNGTQKKLTDEYTHRPRCHANRYKEKKLGRKKKKTWFKSSFFPADPRFFRLKRYKKKMLGAQKVVIHHLTRRPNVDPRHVETVGCRCPSCRKCARATEPTQAQSNGQ